MVMLINDAVQLGLDETQFKQCMASEKYKPEIEADLQAGIKADVTGTPTFFINNRTIMGDKPLAAFTYVIDEELKKHG